MSVYLQLDAHKYSPGLQVYELDLHAVALLLDTVEGGHGIQATLVPSL